VVKKDVRHNFKSCKRKGGKMPLIKTIEYIYRNGEKRGVILDIDTFASLINMLEDMKDALDLKKAKAEAKGFTDFDVLVKELKEEGRL